MGEGEALVHAGGKRVEGKVVLGGEADPVQHALDVEEDDPHV